MNSEGSRPIGSGYMLESNTSRVNQAERGPSSGKTLEDAINSGQVTETSSGTIATATRPTEDFIASRKRKLCIDVFVDETRKLHASIKKLREFMSQNEGDPRWTSSLSQAEAALSGLDQDLAKELVVLSRNGFARCSFNIPSNWSPGRRIDVEFRGIRYRGSVPPSGCQPGDRVEFSFRCGAIRKPSLFSKD